MPLLGRHKSPSPSSSQTSTVPTASGANSRINQNQQVCESPLFGTRRQLPINSHLTSQPIIAHRASGNNELPNVGITGRSTATRSRSPPAPERQSSSSLSSNQQTNTISSNMSRDEAGKLLSSIPQQITRQQIHYAFSIMDLNKDGMIDVRDLSQMLANLGLPIDESILSHIMSKLSKRGDHGISESEFLDWIANFIQISDSSPKGSPERNSSALGGGFGIGGGPVTTRAGSRRLAAGGVGPASSGPAKAQLGRSATVSLVAEPEAPRTRRGSGSGLALMRSLSSSAPTSSNSRSVLQEAAAADGEASKSSLAAQANVVSEMEDLKNDLKAAFLVFDVDGDGFITLDEVRAGLELLGESWSPAEVRQVFSKCGKKDLTKPHQQQQQQQQHRINIDEFVQLLL